MGKNPVTHRVCFEKSTVKHSSVDYRVTYRDFWFVVVKRLHGVLCLLHVQLERVRIYMQYCMPLDLHRRPDFFPNNQNKTIRRLRINKPIMRFCSAQQPVLSVRGCKVQYTSTCR
jgi:hypothetical protein